MPSTKSLRELTTEAGCQSFRRGTRHGPESPITGLEGQLRARLLLGGREVRDLLRHQELRTRVLHQALRERKPVLLRGQEFALPVQSKLGQLLQRVLLRVVVRQEFGLLKQSLAFLHQESQVLRKEVLLGDRVAVLPFSRVPWLESRQEFGEVGLATTTRLPHKATGSLGLARGSALRVELVLLHESLPDGLLGRVLLESLHREAVLFRELLPVFLLRDFGRARAGLLAEEQLLVGGELSSCRDLPTCSPVTGRGSQARARGPTAFVEALPHQSFRLEQTRQSERLCLLQSPRNFSETFVSSQSSKHCRTRAAASRLEFGPVLEESLLPRQSTQPEPPAKSVPQSFPRCPDSLDPFPQSLPRCSELWHGPREPLLQLRPWQPEPRPALLLPARAASHGPAFATGKKKSFGFTIAARSIGFLYKPLIKKAIPSTFLRGSIR